jgi:hypothetical protein
VPLVWEELPPDHPLFTQGVAFVFRSDLPAEDDEVGSDDDEPEAA